MNNKQCNNCGGEYEYRNGRWICRACGAFRPEEISNEEVTLLYTAYQTLRMANFDESEKAFDDIIEKYPENPNAYWGRLMAKYGIKYERDYDGRMIPTCYATSIESFFDASDYKNALKYSDRDTQEYYRSQAEYIERVREEWVEKANKEEPYDIFICYKDSDLANDIERTQDSVTAQDIYIHLTNKGYRVFYSHESLRDKVGEKYEPYIFNALSTAKVMLVYGSKPEYITSTWLKNEWTRYEKRMRAGEKDPNSLLVACEGFSPSELPTELSSRQCFNAGEKSFYSDLDEKIEEIVHPPKPKEKESGGKKSRATGVLVTLLLLFMVAAAGVFFWYTQNNPGGATSTVTNSEHGITATLGEGELPEGTEFHVEKVPNNETVKNKVSELDINHKTFVVYDMTLMNGGNALNLSGNVTVSLPLPEGISEKNAVVYYLDGRTPQKMLSNASGGKVTFFTNHFSQYMIAEEVDCEHNRVIDPAVEPTCTETGLSEGAHCSECGKILVAQETLLPAHKPSKVDCELGQSCTVCGEKLAEALGHDYTHRIVYAGCTDQGYTLHTCTKCQESYKDTFTSPLGHNPGEAATCTEPQRCTRCREVLAAALGHTSGGAATCLTAEVCTVCNATMTEALGHDHEADIDAATCTESGLAVYTCTRCDDSYEVFLERLGHKLPATATCGEAATCVLCGELMESVNGHVPGLAPTCTDPQRCLACKLEIAPATGHNHEVTVVDPTCTEKGYTLHACACGDSYTTDETEALGHTLAEGATCTEGGECTVCGQHIESAEGHIPGLPATCTEPQRCLACGDAVSPALGHTSDTPADCLNPEICTVCQAEITPALGHTPGPEATCTHTQNCTVCGVELAPIAPHSYEAKVTAPTCTERGYTTHTCKCGDSYIDTYQAPYGHTFGEGISCTQGANCLVCGVRVESTGEHLPGLEASCTLPQICQACGELLAPATGHRPADPVCGDPLTCAVCNEILGPVQKHGFWVPVTLPAPEEIYSAVNHTDYPFLLESGVLVSSNHNDSSSSSYQITALRAFTLELEYRVSSENQYDYFTISVNGVEQVRESGETVWTYVSYALNEGDVVTFTYSKDPTGASGEDRAFVKLLTEQTSDIGLEFVEATDGYLATLPPPCTDDIVCDICGKVLVAHTGHTEVVDPAVAPTESENGHTAGSHCSVCGEVLIEPDVLYATGTKGLLFRSNGDGTYSVIGLGTATGTEIHIPYYYNGARVTAIGESAFAEQTHLTRIVLPESLTTIGYRAFYGCSGLTEMTIPASVTEIGMQIFYRCVSLTTLYYNSDYGDYDNNPFIQQSDITKVVFGGQRVPYRFLYQDGEITEIVILDSVTEIGSEAFRDCTALVKASVGNGIHTVGDYAFSGCRSLCELTLGENVTAISVDAFRNCSSLAELVLPDGLTVIHDSAFNGCSALTGVTFGGAINAIGDNAFAGCSSLEEIVIPNSVMSLGAYVFKDCVSLRSVELSDAISSVPQNAFMGCTSLVNVLMHDTVVSVGAYAFYNCSSLMSITVPSSVTSIGNEAFWGCTKLIEVINLSSMSLTPGDYGYGYVAYYAKEVHDGLSKLIEVDDFVFYLDEEGVYSLVGYKGSETALVLPASVEGSTYVIDAGAFRGRKDLVSVTVPSGVTAIGEGAFAGCSGLIEMTLPFVGGEAAQEAGRITLLGYIFGTNHYDGARAVDQHYSDGSYAESFYIPASLARITVTGGNIFYGAFCNCTMLTDVTLGEGITEIGAKAFYNCTALTSVEIPESLTAIGEEAFYNCTQITDDHRHFGGGEATCSAPGLCVICGAVVTDKQNHSFLALSGVDGLIFANDIDHPFLIRDGVLVSNDHDSASAAVFRITARTAYTLRLEYRVSSEGQYDWLTVKHNSAQLDSISGETEWKTLTVALEAGDTLTVTYSKDGGGNYGDDCGYVKLLTPNGEPLAWEMTEATPEYIATLTPHCTEDILCDVCGGVVIPHAGHTEVIDPAVPPTQTSDGLTEGSHCSVCGEILIAQNPVSAAGSPGLEYRDNGDGTYTLIGIGETTDTEIYVPAYHDGKRVTAIADSAFSEQDGITKVVIAEGIESIGYRAFYGCSALTEVTIPSTVTDIGTQIFYTAENLTTLRYDSTYYDNNNLFIDQSAVTKIIFGGQYIPSYILRGNNRVTEVVILDSVTSISANAFYGAQALTRAEIGNGVERISTGAFYGCEALTELSLGAGLQTVESDAFYGCTSLCAITLSESVRTIGSSAFYGCTALASVTVNGAESIGDNAFYGCTALTSVTLLEGVQFIGSRAFRDCVSLSEITLPDSVQTVNSEAFRGCTALTEVSLGKGVTSIREDAFRECTALAAMTVPSNVRSVGQNAFYGCTALADLTLENGVSSIGAFAFFGCTSLETVTVPNSVTSMEQDVFTGCTSLRTATLSDALTSVPYATFRNCSSLTSVTLNGIITQIGEYAFENCLSLTSITVPRSVTWIGGNAFYGCYKLVEVINLSTLDISAGNSNYGYIAYYAKEVHDGESKLIREGDYVFYFDGEDYFLVDYKGSETALTLPASVLESGYSIYSYAFYNRSELTSVTVPDTVKAIGECAFAGCSGLTEMTLPFVGGSAESAQDYRSPFGYIFGTVYYEGSVAVMQIYDSYGSNSTYYIPAGLTKLTVTGANIPFGAFYGCNMLTEVTLGEGITSIGSRAFLECTALEKLGIPESLTEIGELAFYGCENLSEDHRHVGGEEATCSEPQLCLICGAVVTETKNHGFWEEVTLPEATEIYTTENDAEFPFSFENGELIPTNREFNSYATFTLTATESFLLRFEYWVNCDDGIRIRHNDSDIVDTAGWYGSMVSSEVLLRPGDTVTFRYRRSNNSRTEDYVLVKILTDSESQTFFDFIEATPEYIETVPPLCLEDICCDVCGGVVIPKAGHTEVTDKAVAPTVNTDGLTEGSHCSVCGEILIPQETVYALGTEGLLFETNADGETCTLVGMDNAQATEIYVPAYHDGKRVTAVADSALAGLAAVKKITLAEGIETVGYRAFYSCPELVELTVPSTVRSVGAQILYTCPKFDTLYYNSTYYTTDNFFIQHSTVRKIVFGGEYVPGYILQNNATVTEVEILLEVGEIRTNAFYGCAALVSAKIGGVVSVGDNAFRNCTALAEVTLAEGVENIHYNAFHSCTALSEITLPASVTEIYSGAFRGCTALASVTLGEGLQNIGDSAFYGCSALTEITVPDGVSSVGSEAFRECTSLAAVTFPDGVSSIGAYAFCGCTALSELTVPESVKTVGAEAFRDCTSLRSLTLEDGITTLETGAFRGCSALETVRVPNSVMNMGYEVFRDCTSLKTATLSDAISRVPSGTFQNCGSLTEASINGLVTTIGNDAFRGCISLTSVTIPVSVTSIDSNAFYECYKLVEVINLSTLELTAGSDGYGYVAHYAKEVHNGESKLIEVDGFVFWLDGEGVYSLIGYTGEEKDLVLPASVNESPYAIYPYAFYRRADLTSVEIPEGVTAIGAHAFENCAGLTAVSVPESLTAIEDYVFSGCTGLTAFAFPTGVQTVGKYAFADCAGLSEITVPEGVTSIGECAFAGCTGLTEMTLPFVGADANPDRYADYARVLGYIFGREECEGARQVIQYYSDYSSYYYYIPESLTKVTVTGGYVGFGAFYGCTMLTEVTLGDGVTGIYSRAFSGCTGLTEVTLGAGVTEIGAEAFRDCSSLCEITIPESVTVIQIGAFTGCSGLTEMTIPFVGNRPDEEQASDASLFGYIFGDAEYGNSTAVTQIYNSAGSNRTYYIPTGLTKVTVTGGNILYGAFCGCHTLTEVVLGEGITAIGERAFYECTALADIGIPESLTEVGADAFYGCSSLSEDHRHVGGPKATCAAPQICLVCGTVVTVAPNHGFWSEEEVTLPEAVEVYEAQNAETSPFVLEDGVLISSNHYGGSSSTYTVTALRPFLLKLEYGVSSEQGCDWLTVKHNDEELARVSGTVSMTALEISLRAGDTVTFTYSKDGSVNSGVTALT